LITHDQALRNRSHAAPTMRSGFPTAQPKPSRTRRRPLRDDRRCHLLLIPSCGHHVYPQRARPQSEAHSQRRAQPDAKRAAGQDRRHQPPRRRRRRRRRCRWRGTSRQLCCHRRGRLAPERLTAAPRCGSLALRRGLLVRRRSTQLRRLASASWRPFVCGGAASSSVRPFSVLPRSWSRQAPMQQLKDG
jgi:hypothetical protein